MTAGARLIGVRTDGEFVREIVYLPESMRLVEPANAVTQRLARQLEAYYADLAERGLEDGVEDGVHGRGGKREPGF